MQETKVRRRTWLWPCVLYSLLGSAPVDAQQPPQGDTLRLSLDRAVTRVLEQSEEIAAARVQVDLAELQITEATSPALPQLSTNLTYNRAIRTIFDDLGGPPSAEPDTGQDGFGDLFKDLPFGRRNNYIATLQLSQLLFSGGSIAAAREVARTSRSASRNRLEETRADLTFQVRTAYLNAVLARQLHTIAVESRRVAEQHLEQVKSFYEAGTASEFDLLRARVDRENREPAVVQAQNAADLAELELKRLINVPADKPLLLVTELEPDSVIVDEEELARVMGQRPALAAAREVVSMREVAVRVYRGQRLPTVRLLGNLGFQAFPENAAPPGPSKWREDWSVSVAVAWNPFDGFSTRAQIGEAQAQLRQAHLQEDQLREALEMELAAAMAEYRRSRAQIGVTRQTVALAERTLELAEVRYSNGLSTQLEVSDAALLFDQARVNHVQAQHDYAEALAQLERTSGGQIQLLRFQ